MRIVTFVSNSASTSAKPDVAMNVLRLQLPPQTDKADRLDDNNSDVFLDPTKKSAMVEIQGLSDTEMLTFKAGKRVVVTIEVAKE